MLLTQLVNTETLNGLLVNIRIFYNPYYERRSENMRAFIKVFFGICTLGTSLLLCSLFSSKMSEAADGVADTLESWRRRR